MLRLGHVVKSFGGVQAVRDVSLELAPGRVLAVVGPNGAGKSTLLRMACGLITPDAGTVTFDGEPIADMGSRLYRYLSAVLEDSSLAYMSLRGWANLEYQGALYGLTRRETRERSEAMLDRLDLRRHMDKHVGDWFAARSRSSPWSPRCCRGLRCCCWTSRRWVSMWSPNAISSPRCAVSPTGGWPC